MGVAAYLENPRMTEREIQRQIVAALRQTGWLVYILSRVGTAKGNPGLPDLFVRHTAKRRHAWIEVKRPDGDLSLAQLTFRDAALAAGEQHFVLRDVSEVSAALSEWVTPFQSQVVGR